MSEKPIKLKPCPHCGSTDLAFGEISDDLGDSCAMIRCRECKAEGPRLLGPLKAVRSVVVASKAQAARAWNERQKP